MSDSTIASQDQADPPVAQPASLPAPAPASPGPGLHVWAGRRAGRGHRGRGEPCQDAYAVHVDAARGRAVAAVADGLGSRPLSQHGSQAACDAAVASLQAEPEGTAWDRAAVLRAVAAAHAAVAQAAAGRGLASPHELATTLQVAVLDGGHAVAAMVGDGAIAAAGPAAGGVGGPVLLTAPGTSGYANEVVPLTDPDWPAAAQVAEADGVDTLLLFTDGLTRLLLARDRTGWTPFAPFFDSFLPTLDRPGSAGDAALVDRFLATDAVDRSWDDDKALVVMRVARGV